MNTLTLLAATSRSATFELQNDCCFAPAEPVSLILNGENKGLFTHNVFTVYGLRPDMCYEARIAGEGGESRVSFLTPPEALCFDVTRFGAVGDGKTDCTGALQAAIVACPKNGTVLVPAGQYSTYPLFLKSDMTLYLCKGAVLRAGTDRSRYPTLPGMVQSDDGRSEVSIGSWEGNPLDSFASLITAIGAENVRVAGEGTLDGNAQNGDWWHNAKQRVGAWRPRTVFLNGCKNVQLIGVTICNSPAWTVHPYYCENVDVFNVTIQNPDDSPNTDGCNPESCHNVRIVGTVFSVGDDCIAVKSGKYYMAKNHHRASKNLIVRNCLMDRGHGAIVVGSEVSGGVDGLCVERCVMRGTDRGLRVKTRRGRGSMSVLTGIRFSRIEMDRVKTPFVINMFYFCDPDGRTPYVGDKSPLPVDENTPRVGTLTCRDIVCKGCEVAGGFFYGLPEMPIERIEMENVCVTFAPQAKEGMPAMMDGIDPVKKLALFGANIASLSLKNVRFSGYEGERLQLAGVENFEET